MPLAPAIAASLSAGLPTRARSLWVGGVDVMLQAGAAGNGYGVLIESVRLVEGGPGTVSSLSFTIEDPLLQISLAAGQVVQLHWHTKGIPEFLGFVQAWTSRPDGPSRYIDVIATGIESALDWLMITNLTLPVGMTVQAAVQSAAANAVGTSGIPLRAIAPAGVGQSSQAFPIDGNWTPTLAYAVVLSNTSLRQALAAIGASGTPTDPAWDGYFLEFSVDFYAGLRMWVSLNNIGGPVDYLTIPTAPQPADLRYSVDAGGAIHNVIVAGGNAAGSGLVTDGTGLPGKTGVVNDATSLTAAQRDAIGKSYLEDKGLAYRGTVRLEEPSFEATLAAGTAEVHAGGQIQLDNTPVGLTAFQLRITGLSKQILPNGKANWTINFGGNPPRATDHLRRLTKERYR